MGSIHNTRILRFLLVLSVVILTIFVYASYSTNTTLPHMRSAGSPSALAVAANYDSQLNQQEHTGAANKSGGDSIIGDKNASGNSLTEDDGNKSQPAGVGKLNKKSISAVASGLAALTNNIISTKKQHHRQPTIDEDALGVAGGSADDAADDTALDRLVSNDLLEEQYAQSVDNTAGNLNGSVASPQQPSLLQPHLQGTNKQEQQQLQKQMQLSDNNLNKILDSDVLIPTSNLQKFIENADKILKNITVIQPAINKSTGKDMDGFTPKAEVKQTEQKLPDVNNEKPTDDNDDGDALPPSVVMNIRRGDVASGTVKVASIKTGPEAQSPAVKVPISNGTINTALDTTKGIVTERIYESDHINDEINIDKICPSNGADLKLLILITSAQSHADARLAIRQTWGHYAVRRDVATAFVLGRSTNETLNMALSQENFIYGDLIRGNFIDSYNNLTLKTISALEWVDNHCALAKYILKTDDDMFINVPKLLSFLDRHSKEKRTIFGRLAKKWKPIRNKKSKYYVSTGQFGSSVFPPFTTGPAYVLTNDIIHELYVQALHQVYLKLEDVFTTGIVAQELDIKRVHANEFLNRRIAFNPCNIRKTISVHMIKSNEQFDLWKKLLDQTTKCK